jgi:hypothetical protein
MLRGFIPFKLLGQNKNKSSIPTEPGKNKLIRTSTGAE